MPRQHRADFARLTEPFAETVFAASRVGRVQQLEERRLSEDTEVGTVGVSIGDEAIAARRVAREAPGDSLDGPVVERDGRGHAALGAIETDVPDHQHHEARCKRDRHQEHPLRQVPKSPEEAERDRAGQRDQTEGRDETRNPIDAARILFQSLLSFGMCLGRRAHPLRSAGLFRLGRVLQWAHR